MIIACIWSSAVLEELSIINYYPPSEAIIIFFLKILLSCLENLKSDSWNFNDDMY